MMNKKRKGAEKIMSVYWFAILFIVAAAIVYMVFSFYGKPYDVRNIEASLLSDKIASCFSQGGYINGDWNSITGENMLSQCGLDFNVEDTKGWDNDQYYVGVGVYDFNSGQMLENISAGNQNLKSDCSVTSTNYPVCLQRSMYTLGKNNKQYEVRIFSIVRKTEKNTQ